MDRQQTIASIAALYSPDDPGKTGSVGARIILAALVADWRNLPDSVLARAEAMMQAQQAEDEQIAAGRAAAEDEQTRG